MWGTMVLLTSWICFGCPGIRIDIICIHFTLYIIGYLMDFKVFHNFLGRVSIPLEWVGVKLCSLTIFENIWDFLLMLEIIDRLGYVLSHDGHRDKFMLILILVVKELQLERVMKTNSISISLGQYVYFVV